MKVLEKVKIVCDKIQKRDGIISPQSLVDAARPQNSSIHKQFNWDDEEAAEQYRIWQARELIKKVVIVYEKREIAGYHNVTIIKENRPTQGYLSTITIMSDRDLRRQVIQQALKQLIYWQEQYKTYTELDNLIDKQTMKSLVNKYIKN